jgi:hypothetical protein
MSDHDHADAKLIVAAILAAKMGDFHNTPQGIQNAVSLWRKFYNEITFLDIDADPDEGGNAVRNADY